jgi:hypothetical protein
MRNYKDLLVWEKAHKLTLAVYKITLLFPKDERYGLTSQVRRASRRSQRTWRRVAADDQMARWHAMSRSLWDRALNSPIIFS